MSFTHHTKDISFEDWSKITNTVKRMVQLETESGITICDGSGEAGTCPEINDAYISLNGCGDYSHDSFYLQRTEHSDFGFCKTARKPYGALVVAILTIVEDLGYTTFNSDGEKDELEEGILFGRKTFKDLEEISSC